MRKRKSTLRGVERGPLPAEIIGEPAPKLGIWEAISAPFGNGLRNPHLFLSVDSARFMFGPRAHELARIGYPEMRQTLASAIRGHHVIEVRDGVLTLVEPDGDEGSPLRVK